ncbi:MAG: nitroreductase family protein [Dehalococcoidales bacterium]|nr:nitroreductase family protein [Dehalococcoidales bacterium]
MEVIEAMKTRRSIRRYKATPVDDKTVELVLEAARWAPSWANRQCWRFIVVRDTNIKTQLVNSLVKVESGDTLVDNPSLKAVASAPVVIVACAELRKAGFELGKPATDKGDYWYMYDIALAMQNLALAAHSLGLGTVTIGAMDAKKTGNILGVPEGFCVVSMTPLGYPDQEPKPRPRKELSEIVFHDKFGS